MAATPLDDQDDRDEGGRSHDRIEVDATLVEELDLAVDQIEAEERRAARRVSMIEAGRRKGGGSDDRVA